MTLRQRTLWVLPGLLGLALLARGPAIFDHYINFDDPSFLADNPILRKGLTLEGLRFAFTDTRTTANWIPLTDISYMIDMQLFGPGPLGPHLTNVLLSAGSVLLLFMALRAMTGSPWRSAAVAALLAVHPIHTESIAWVTERKDTLSLFLGLLSLWAYAGYTNRDLHPLSLEGEGGRYAGRVRVIDCTSGGTAPSPQPSPSRERGQSPASKSSGYFYALSLLAFIASLLAKSMLVTLPCVMLLLDYWPLRRYERRGVGRLIVEKLPFLAASTAIAVVTAITQRETMPTTSNIPLSIRLVNIPVAYSWYLWRLVWPVHLVVYYVYQLLWPAWAVVAAPTLLAAISIVVFLQRRNRPWLLVGWLWFLGAMVPVIGLVQVGGAAFACRYAYFPFIGLYVAIAWTLPGPVVFRHRIPAAVAAAAVLALLTVGSMIDARRWKDSFTLFTYNLAMAPNAAIPHINLAVALVEQGQKSAAIVQYERGVAIDLTAVPFVAGLAQLRAQRGDLLAAQSLLRYADMHGSNDPLVLSVWGLVFLKQGRLDRAEAVLREAISLKPNNADYRHELGVALVRLGRIDEAVAANARSVALDPDNADFWKNYGLTLLDARRPAEAVGKLAEATRLDAADAEAWFGLGRALGAVGRWGDALAAYQKAVTIKPEWAVAHNSLGTTLARQGRLDDAIQEFHKALELDPTYDDAAKNLQRAIGLLQAAPASAP